MQDPHEPPIHQVAVASMTQLSPQVFSVQLLVCSTWLLYGVWFFGVLTVSVYVQGICGFPIVVFFLFTSGSSLDLLVHFLLSHYYIPVSFVCVCPCVPVVMVPVVGVVFMQLRLPLYVTIHI